MSASPDSGPDRSILPLPEPENPPITEVDARKATPPPRFELKPPKGAGVTGTIHKVVVGVGPMGEAFDPPLEWHGRG